MTNNTINIDIDALTEDFKAHCKVIKLEIGRAHV